MKFDPLILTQKLSPPRRASRGADGWYPGCLINVINSISKNNREMFDVKLRVTGPNGKVREMRDFVHTAMPKKFKDFCIACGVESQYASGAVDAADIQPDIEIKVPLTVERRRGFRPENSVIGYAPASSVAVTPPLRVVAS